MHIDIPFQTFHEEQKERNYINGRFQAAQLVENDIKDRIQKHIIKAMRERGLSEICFSEIETSIIAPPIIAEEGEHAISLFAININARGTVEVASDDEDGIEQTIGNVPCRVAIDILNTFEEIIVAYDNDQYEVDDSGSLCAKE